ncbi:MFS transporter [Shouchella patagoniensis]|uniref:MFS transporter n=1 Tax=Shouchella patagoniensis TaxID=228576 RepID=UPI000994C2DF|nr:MFS transporter [Shouchella patagoniensis]
MYITLFKNNQSLVYYLGSTAISNVGNVMTGLAFLFLAFELTESSMHVTGVAMSQVLPYLLFGLVGGVIADWIPKRKWMIAMDLLRVPLLLVLVMLHYMEMLAYGHLIVVSFTNHVFGCFFNPAHRSLLPLITSDVERTAANSLVDTVTRGMTVLGPILSVFLMNTIGVIHFFTLDALTFLGSALLLAKIKLKEEKGKPISEMKRTAIVLSLKEFAVWLIGHGTMRRLFVVTGAIVFLNTWVWQVGLLLILNETMTNGKALYSFLLSWYGAIVIVVNLVIPYFIRIFTMNIYLISSFIWGIGIVLIGFAQVMPVYFLGVFIAALGLPLSGLARVYLLQKHVPTEKLARGFSFNAVLLYLANLVSLGFFGLLSKFVSTYILFLFCGGMMVLVSILFIRRVVQAERSV